jgi:4-amino-4-deoxy-L-arabinose transferase-like glycosyltransferase
MTRYISGRPFHIALSVLSIVWLLFGYSRYLSNPSWDAIKTAWLPILTFLATSGLVDLVIVAALWAASDELGDRFLRLLGVRLNPGVERLALSSGAGLSLLSLATTILTVANLLYALEAWILVSTPALFWLLRRVRSTRNNPPPQATGRSSGDARFEPCSEVSSLLQEQDSSVIATPRPSARQTTSVGQRFAHGFLWTYIALALLITLISALGPAIEYDDVAYHLAGPKVYVQKHRFQALPDNPVTFMPKNVEMLFALGMRLHNEVTAKLIHFLMGLLAMQAAYALGARLFSKTAGLIAVAVLTASPLFLWEMRTAHIDVGLALYVFLALHTAIVWLQRREPSWYRLLVCLLGFSLGIKYHGLLALGAVAVIIVLHDAVVMGRPSQAVKAGFKLVLFSLAGLLIPWGLINLFLTGNPVFPLLAELFPTRHWSPELTQLILHQQRDAGIPLTLAHWQEWVTAAWQLFISEPGKFKGNLGLFCFLLPPLMLVQRRISLEVKLVLAFSLTYSLLWFVTAQHARYFLVVLPGLAAVGGGALASWLSLWRSRPGRGCAWAMSLLLALMAVGNLPFFDPQGSSYYGFQIVTTLPTRYLLGLESRDDYLARHIEGYQATRFFNQLRGPKKLFFAWNTHPSIYYSDAPASYHFSPFAPRLFSEDPAELRQVLKRSGITHLLTAQPQQAAYLLTRPEGKFVQAHLKELHRNTATVLYEFSDEPLTQDATWYDFLDHIGDATIRVDGKPITEPNTDFSRVIGIDSDIRYSLVGFPNEEVEYTVALCERPVLRFAVGQAAQQCSGKALFEIWLSHETGEPRLLYSRELYAEKNPHDSGWFEERLNLDDFAGKRVRIRFKTSHLEGGPCNWYCWADPVILSVP